MVDRGPYSSGLGREVWRAIINTVMNIRGIS